VQYKIFVSYSTHDIEQVELLRQQLNGTPIEVFIAEHSVYPSEDLSQTISEAIKDCDLFVVLWSENAQDSGWVSQEIGRAGALNKSILPLVLNEGLTLPGFISNLKYIPVYKDPKQAVEKARELIVKSYNNNAHVLAQIEKKKQKDKEALALMGIGAFLLWAFSK
jgi:TIR domain-containing protein